MTTDTSFTTRSMTMTTRGAGIAGLVAIVLTLAWSGAVAAGDDAAGFIHGTLTTRSGSSYTGFLRWDDEEAFWDDVFHSAKQDMKLLEKYEHDDEGRANVEERWWRLFGKRLRVSWSDARISHVFAARFGDIAEIEMPGEGEATVRMKTGSVFHVKGYANDVTATVHVTDPDLGQIEVPWRKIERVHFSPAPAGAVPPAARLAGTVTTTDGSFDGFVMWDSQECLASDMLDGDTEDGRVSLAMGGIATIERHSRASARVVLRDGRELVLDGTNDVNDSIRGIFIEDRRFGRVEVPWDEFRRLELRPATGSGRPYDAFDGEGILHGRVTTTDGTVLAGRLVYDLDEAEGWEMLDGSDGDLEYAIPFAMIAAIEPQGRETTKVTLRNGTILELSDSQDVTNRNDGVLVTPDAGAETRVPWAEVRRIDLGD